MDTKLNRSKNDVLPPVKDMPTYYTVEEIDKLETENKKLRECLGTFVHIPLDATSAPETWFSERARKCLKSIK